MNYSVVEIEDCSGLDEFLLWEAEVLFYNTLEEFREADVLSETSSEAAESVFADDEESDDDGSVYFEPEELQQPLVNQEHPELLVTFTSRTASCSC